MTMESWPDTKSGQDWNHAWSTSPTRVIAQRLMGIRPLAPGFEKVLIAPVPGGMAEAAMVMPTIRGGVRAAFRNAPNALEMAVDIPANMTARVELPRTNAIKKVLVNSQPATTRAFDKLPPGRHVFEVKYP